MLKYLRDKLFDLKPTATTDLWRSLRHDFVAAVFTRHIARHMSGIGHQYPGLSKNTKVKKVSFLGFEFVTLQI